MCVRSRLGPGGAVSAAPLRVAIVGGGVTGLAAAYALEQRPEPIVVTLLEASRRLGGKVQTDRIGRLVLERGPDALFLRSPFALDVLGQLGLGDDVVHAQPSQRQGAILRGGRFHPLPEGMESGVPRTIGPMVTTGLLSPLGKVRAAAEVALPRARVKGDESVDAFVRRRFGAEVAEWIAAPLLGSIYANDTRELSLLATLPHLRNWEQEHGSLLLASLRGRLPGARRNPTGLSPFISLRTGLTSLVAALHAGCGRTEVRLGATVTAIEPIASGYRLQVAGAQGMVADRVILAAPAFVSGDLLEALSPAAAAHLRAIRYASATVVALLFSSEAAAAVPHGSGFLVAPGEASLLKACSWSSQKWPHCTPDGELLVRCHLQSETPDDDATLVEAVRTELRELVGLRAVPVLARVYRWPRSVASYSVGHLERLHAIGAALAEFPGLVLAGAGLRGVGVPECLRQGIAAAERALQSCEPGSLCHHVES
jgi:oxygen-dependent protoporphyrinogen oxidase